MVDVDAAGGAKEGKEEKGKVITGNHQCILIALFQPVLLNLPQGQGENDKLVRQIQGLRGRTYSSILLNN